MSLVRLACFFIALLSAYPAQAQTQKYPVRPVKILVPFAPGGVVDVMARLLAQKMSEGLGEAFYVENHGGAGGNIGTASVAMSPPDGYTVLATSSSFVLNPSLYAKLPYDTRRDFTAVTIASASPNVLVVNPSLPVTSVKQMIEFVKKNPGQYNLASSGIGTTPHFSGEILRQTLGLDIVNIPFNGAGPAITAAIGGHVPIAFVAAPAAASNVKQGLLRALAVTSDKRLAALPDVPTMAELGYAGQEVSTLLCVLVPAGTPREIVDTLHREIARIVALPDIREKFDALGFQPMTVTPEQATARISAEIDRWAGVVRAANITPQ